MNKKSGLSMGGTIENTRNVKAVKSKCSKCYHRKYYKHSKKGTYYCDFYKIDYPNKSYCKRFYELEPLSREESNLVKQHNEEIKRKRKEANTPKKTTLEKISTVLGCSLTEQEIFSNNKRNSFGNGKFKIQAVDKSQYLIDVFFNDKEKSKQRYQIIKKNMQNPIR